MNHLKTNYTPLNRFVLCGCRERQCNGIMTSIVREYRMQVFSPIILRLQEWRLHGHWSHHQLYEYKQNIGPHRLNFCKPWTRIFVWKSFSITHWPETGFVIFFITLQKFWKLPVRYWSNNDLKNDYSTNPTKHCMLICWTYWTCTNPTPVIWYQTFGNIINPHSQHVFPFSTTPPSPLRKLYNFFCSISLHLRTHFVLTAASNALSSLFVQIFVSICFQTRLNISSNAPKRARPIAKTRKNLKSFCSTTILI